MGGGDRHEAVATGLVGGMIYAIYGFVGFENAVPLAEEARDPRRTVLRVSLLSPLILGLFIILCTYAATVYFGPSGFAGFPASNGGDAWVAIDRASGAVSSEVTDRGWISYLNDLHKGRNSGGEWSLFIDVFAFACLIFAITGLFLLWLHSAKRKSTWPLVGAGLILPAAIAIIFIH